MYNIILIIIFYLICEFNSCGINRNIDKWTDGESLSWIQVMDTKNLNR